MLIELSRHLAELQHYKLLTLIHYQECALPKLKKTISTTIHKLNCRPEPGFNFEGFPRRETATASGKYAKQNLNKNEK
jgi:hypothetical protein